MIAEALSSTPALNRKQSYSKTVAMSACAASHQTSDKLARRAYFSSKTLPRSLAFRGKQSKEPSEQGSLPKSFSAALASHAAK